MSSLTFKPGEATKHINRQFGEYLLDSGFCSNFTIRCHGKEWKVHREILADRCDYFHNMFKGNWTECTAGVVEFQDDPNTIHVIVRYLYTLEANDLELEIIHPRKLCEEAGLTNLQQLTVSARLQTQWQSCIGKPPHKLFNNLLENELLCNTAASFRLILLYAASDRLGIMVNRKTGASDLSIEVLSVVRKLEKTLVRSSFVEILRLVFSKVPSQEKEGLREHFVATCLLNAEIIQENPDVCKLLEREEPIAWRLGSEYRKRFKDTEYRANRAEEICRALNHAASRRHGSQMLGSAEEGEDTAL